MLLNLATTLIVTPRVKVRSTIAGDFHLKHLKLLRSVFKTLSAQTPNHQRVLADSTFKHYKSRILAVCVKCNYISQERNEWHNSLICINWIANCAKVKWTNEPNGWKNETSRERRPTVLKELFQRTSMKVITIIWNSIIFSFFFFSLSFFSLRKVIFWSDISSSDSLLCPRKKSESKNVQKQFS